MTDKLPPNLLALFAPRPALRYLPHCDQPPEKRRTAPVTGVAAFLDELRKPDPDYVPTESWLQKRDRKQLEKKQAQEERIQAGLQAYNPDQDPNIRGDPYRTLFISRLSYDVKEPDLEREFGRFGPIERIRIIRHKETNKQRGYAFIVYEREKDMKAAYKETDGIRIKDRRVLVDVERGRTVKGWKPRRIGGGLGGRGYTKVQPTRPVGPVGDRGFGGGPRGGGFRGGPGGFRGGRGGFSGGNRFEVGGGGRGPRGGIGYQGGGGFGDRGGHSNGFGGEAPPNAPTGPGGRRGGGFGGHHDGGSGGRGGFDRGYNDRGGFHDRGGGGGSGGGYDRRSGGGGHDHDRPPRDRGYGDRDGDRGGRSYGGHRDDRHDDGGYSRKRAYDDGGYGGGGDRHRRRY